MAEDSLAVEGQVQDLRRGFECPDSVGEAVDGAHHSIVLDKVQPVSVVERCGFQLLDARLEFSITNFTVRVIAPGRARSSRDGFQS